MATRRRVSGLFVGIAVVTLAACSGSSPSASPTSPSPLGGSSVTTGATVRGTVVGATTASATEIGANNVPGLVVTVEGTGLSTTTDGAGRFSLAGVPPGDVPLRFSGQGINAQLVIGSVTERQQVEIQVALSGSHARVTSEHRSSPDNRVEQRGTVSALAGTCPSLTFTVGTTTFYTDASTRFEHGRCVDTRNGDRVHAEGARQADGRVLASEVEFEGQDDDDDDDDDRDEVEVRGVVSGLAGTCPALTFTVNGVQILTNASTRFEHGTCADTRNNDRVEVEGSRQADGRVLARKVEFDDDDDDHDGDDDDDDEDDDEDDDDRDDAEVRGAVSRLGGSCPNLSFTVNGTTVQTNSATRFEHGTCSVVQNGRRVEVEGTRQSNNSILARKVELD